MSGKVRKLNEEQNREMRGYLREADKERDRGRYTPNRHRKADREWPGPDCPLGLEVPLYMDIHSIKLPLS